MTTWTLPRETVEWVGPVTITHEGEPVGTFELALLPRALRPTESDWAAPTDLEGQAGYLINTPLDPGVHRLWARVPGVPETPVLDDVGTVIIT